MSLWEQYKLEEKIIDILNSFDSHDKGHHFGKPFATPYQIAIEFKKKYPDDFIALDMPLGGKGTGQHNSFAQYIARELSRRIKDSEINVEGRFLYRGGLNELSYENDGVPVESSLEKSFDLSMFRIAK